jgi:hypothetical protein
VDKLPIRLKLGISMGLKNYPPAPIRINFYLTLKLIILNLLRGRFKFGLSHLTRSN